MVTADRGYVYFRKYKDNLYHFYFRKYKDNLYQFYKRCLAQLVEQYLYTVSAGGSSPSTPIQILIKIYYTRPHNKGLEVFKIADPPHLPPFGGRRGGLAPMGAAQGAVISLLKGSL